MNRYRAAARRYRREGESARATFQPKAKGVPLRMYRWWKRQSPNSGRIYRENFCHYWRIVLIWAPLWGVRRAAEAVWNSRYGRIGTIGTLLALYVALSIVFHSAQRLVLGPIVTLLITLYIVVGLIFSLSRYTDIRAATKITTTKLLPPYLWLRRHQVLYLVAMGLWVPLLLLVWIADVMASVLESRQAEAFGRWLRYKRVLRRLTPLHLLGIAILLGLEALSVVLAHNWRWVIGTAILAAIIFVVNRMLDWLVMLDTRAKARRLQYAEEARRQKELAARDQLDPVIRKLFRFIYPDATVFESGWAFWRKWEEWRDEYFKQVDEGILAGHASWRQCATRHALPLQAQFRLTGEQHRLIMEEILKIFPPAPPRPIVEEVATKPSWFSRVVSEAGSLLDLIWTIIRVKKWKICPFVDLDDGASAEQESSSV